MTLSMKERWSRLAEKAARSGLVVRAVTLFDSMSPRDRRLALLMVSMITVMVVVVSGWSAKNYLRRLEQDIVRQQGQLVRVEQVRAQHESLKARIERLEAQLKEDPDFNLTAFLERSASESGIAGSINIQTKSDVANDGFREVSVEVRLRKQSLVNILRYLYAIETARQRLTIKSLRLRTAFGSKSNLNADLEVSVLAPQET